MLSSDDSTQIENEEGEIDNIVVSHLPSWVLKMRQKIDDSRNKHDDAVRRILNLNQVMDNLSEKLEQFHPLLIKETNDDIKSKNVTYPKQELKMKHLPLDVLTEVFFYLQISDVFQFSNTSMSFSCLTKDSNYWKYLARTDYSYLFSFNRGNIKQESELNVIRTYLGKKRQCNSFIDSMKEQRCVPKHKQVDPRRYSRSEKSVSHPLPVFDARSSDGVGHSIGSIMSQSDTLSSDFRGIAHVVLEKMVQLTSSLFDDFNLEIVQNGVVTVLVSLLSNEESALQNYSCMILANLLLWESMVKQQPLNVKLKEGNVSEQVSACNGKRHLSILLTSPSASVNLATPKVNSSAAQKLTKAKTTSSIQGVCNKQASRALVCLFYPDKPIFDVSTPSTLTILKGTSLQSKYLPPLDVENVWKFPSSTSDQSVTHLLSLREQLNEETFARPWQFTYFYKSGAFKDQFIVNLRFYRDGVLAGRGIDSIGYFSMNGSTEVDIIGANLYLNKVYTRSASFAEVTEDWMHVTRSVGVANGDCHVKHVAYWSQNPSHCGYENAL